MSSLRVLGVAGDGDSGGAAVLRDARVEIERVRVGTSSSVIVIRAMPSVNPSAACGDGDDLVAVNDCMSSTAVRVKVAETSPEGMVTVAGTVASDVSSLRRSDGEFAEFLGVAENSDGGAAFVFRDAWIGNRKGQGRDVVVGDRRSGRCRLRTPRRCGDGNKVGVPSTMALSFAVNVNGCGSLLQKEW